MRQLRGTKYKKVKADDSSKTFPNSRFTGKPYTVTTVGKVHLMFLDKETKAWRFVCGKRTESGPWGEKRWGPIADSAQVTCRNCQKHAPDIVTIFDDAVKAAWDEIPDLDEFQ